MHVRLVTCLQYNSHSDTDMIMITRAHGHADDDEVAEELVDPIYIGDLLYLDSVLEFTHS